MADHTNCIEFDELETDKKRLSVELGDVVPSEDIDELLPFYYNDDRIGIDTPEVVGINFYYPTKEGATDTVSLSSQWLPVLPEDELKQTIHKTGSGDIAVYNSPFTDRILNVNIGELVPQHKRIRLYKFIRNIVRGAVRPFDYEDETGTLYRVKCISSPTWEMKYWLKYTINLKLWIISFRNTK